MYGVGTARNQARMFGLASGLDTESLVKGMTTAISNRITQQMQLKQTVQWKMDSYRAVSSMMIDFNNKYLTYASKSNMLTSTFYNSYTTKANGINAGMISVSGKPASGNLSIVSISSTASAAAFMGKQNVSGSKITTGAIDFSATGRQVNNLEGQTLNLEYDGKVYTVKFGSGIGSTPAAVTAAFNAALAEIDIGEGETLDSKISMSSTGGDGFTIDSSDGKDVKVSGGSVKALAILGLQPGDGADGGGTITSSIDMDALITMVKAGDASGKTLSFNYNGITRNVVIGAFSEGATDAQTKANFLAAVQEGLDGAFGTNRIKAGFDGDSLTFETVKGSAQEPDTTSTLTLVGGSPELFGSGILNTNSGLSNRLNMSQSLQTIFGSALQPDGEGKFSLNVNGRTFSFNGSQSLSSVINEINNSNAGVKIEYLSTTDRFSVTATETGAHGSVNIVDSGSSNLASVLFGTGNTVRDGRDAEIEISYDGGFTTATLTRSTNFFAIDGLEITLHQGAAFAMEPGNAITFTSSVNTDAIFGGIMEMVNLYNDLMDLVNKELTTRPDRNYYPLTPEMKAEMKDKEIELWEEKANSGLLFGDPTLRSVAADLRFIFSNEVPGMGRMSEFGISTGSSYWDNGKITIDEEKLRKAIEERPDDVANLFTMQKSSDPGATSMDAGIMNRIKGVLDKYSATTGAFRGTLVNIAGIKGNFYEKDSRLFKQLEEIDRRLETLSVRKKADEDRYYRQFTTLEKYISQMSSQSNWLFSQSQ